MKKERKERSKSLVAVPLSVLIETLGGHTTEPVIISRKWWLNLCISKMDAGEMYSIPAGSQAVAKNGDEDNEEEEEEEEPELTDA